MKHVFLDFDRTLFNTDRFYNTLESREFIGSLRKDNLNLADFLYPDVVPFLKYCQNVDWKCYLVTFGERVVQEPKFLGCNISMYFNEAFYVESGSKVAVIEAVVGNNVSHENIFFVDDTIEHLETFSMLFRTVKAFKMSRPRAKGSEIHDLRFVTVTNLNQVTETITC